MHMASVGIPGCHVIEGCSRPLLPLSLINTSPLTTGCCSHPLPDALPPSAFIKETRLLSDFSLTLHKQNIHPSPSFSCSYSFHSLSSPSHHTLPLSSTPATLPLVISTSPLCSRRDAVQEVRRRRGRRVRLCEGGRHRRQRR